MTTFTPEQLIRHLGLKPLPLEGGYFRETYRAGDSAALPARTSAARPLATAIYFLLTSEPDSFSAMHKLASDEIYHFYSGDPVELLLLYPGGRAEHIVLGPDIFSGQHVQFVVPRGVWQGSRVIRGGEFALLGTTMAPGFDPSDFTLGTRQKLNHAYPQHTDLIHKLTRA